MKNNSLGSILAKVGVMIIAFYALSFVQFNEPKCISPDCNNDQAYGSSYCYTHKDCVWATEVCMVNVGEE